MYVLHSKYWFHYYERENIVHPSSKSSSALLRLLSLRLYREATLLTPGMKCTIASITVSNCDKLWIQRWLYDLLLVYYWKWRSFLVQTRLFDTLSNISKRWSGNSGSRKDSLSFEPRNRIIQDDITLRYIQNLYHSEKALRNLFKYFFCYYRLKRNHRPKVFYLLV